MGLQLLEVHELRLQLRLMQVLREVTPACGLAALVFAYLETPI